MQVFDIEVFNCPTINVILVIAITPNIPILPFPPIPRSLNCHRLPATNHSYHGSPRRLPLTTRQAKYTIIKHELIAYLGHHPAEGSGLDVISQLTRIYKSPQFLAVPM